VFTISNFSTSNSLNLTVVKNCLYRGSDITRSDSPVYVCGNGIVEPGEDCDIAQDGEEPGKSCTYNCLRPVIVILLVILV
jgi:hypothetical protein